MSWSSNLLLYDMCISHINAWVLEKVLKNVSVHSSILLFQAKQSTNGLEIDGRRIRVDFSITKRAHTPTPGVYMGKATQ